MYKVGLEVRAEAAPQGAPQVTVRSAAFTPTGVSSGLCQVHVDKDRASTTARKAVRLQAIIRRGRDTGREANAAASTTGMQAYR
jgi:hypothetical protein